LKTEILKSIIAVFSVLSLINVSYSQWFQLTTNTTETLQDIYFINFSTGIAVGTNGKIIRTTDSGLNWYSVTSGTSYSLYSLEFPDVMTGFAGGYTGVVLRTLNAGTNWTARTPCGIPIRCISFLNVNTGITAGGGTLMCFTTDAGQNWNPRYVPQYMVSSITFINSTTLIASACDTPGAKIYKSTNTANDWSAVLTLDNTGLDVTYTLSYVHFRDASTGYCTGSRSLYGQTWGSIYRSSNGGDNWELCGSIGPAAGSGLNGIHFCDSCIGFTVGNNGVIMCSTNSGTNWSTQQSGTSVSLNAVYMLNALTGYVCGSNGTILKTTNGGITSLIRSGTEIPDNFCLNQNYPNPFNPTTKIKFQIPQSPLSRGVPASSGRGMSVRLTIYDLLGRDVATLVNEQLKPGTYEIEWDGTNYPSGVYFYRLIAGDFNEVKRMVLLK
jgi:photosystem II stability/assembly factor-like uncharacterized protein